MAELERDVDALPDSWHSIRLGDVVDTLVAGVSVNADNRKIGVGEIGVLKTSCVSGGQFVADEHKAVLANEVGRVRTSVEAGSIIISRMNTPALVGANAYVEQDHSDLFLPDRLWQLRTNASADCRWLSYFIQTAKFRLFIDDIATGTSGSMKNISKERLLRLPLTLPPLDEQRRIAEVLRSVDEGIAATHAVVIQMREARSHRLEAFMALPGAYKRIEDVCRLSGGNGFPIKYQGKASGRYPFAKVSDMNRPGNEVLMRHAENYVDEADLRTLKAKPFAVGTTFFPKVGATLLTNKRRIAAIDMLVDNNVMGAVATDIDPWFLYYAFCTIDMADYVQPGAVPSVNQRTIGQIMIPVPSRSEQEVFAQSMRDLDLAIEAQSDALAQLRKSKALVAADLLSGNVRLPT